MSHKGIREFDGQELSSVALGQNGFVMIPTGVTAVCWTGVWEGIEYFIALKAINADTEIEAVAITDGDDLSLNASGGAYVYNGSSPVDVLNGDIIYGAFDRVKAANNTYVVCYIGKRIN